MIYCITGITYISIPSKNQVIVFQVFNTKTFNSYVRTAVNNDAIVLVKNVDLLKRN